MGMEFGSGGWDKGDRPDKPERELPTDVFGGMKRHFDGNDAINRRIARTMAQLEQQRLDNEDTTPDPEESTPEQTDRGEASDAAADDHTDTPPDSDNHEAEPDTDTDRQEPHSPEASDDNHLRENNIEQTDAADTGDQPANSDKHGPVVDLAAGDDRHPAADRGSGLDVREVPRRVDLDEDTGRGMAIDSASEETEHKAPDAVPGKPPRPSDVVAIDRADVARSSDNQPAVGDSDGSIGQWVGRNRSDRGVEDQEWGTGVDRLPNGQTIEYVVPSGKYPVEFDGHLFRGDPPVEVFQEVKGNYDFTYKPFPPGMSIERKTQDLIDKWVEQAQRQADAIDSTGADHEWILTQNPELVEPLQKALNQAELPIDVRYVPRTS